LFEEK